MPTTASASHNLQTTERRYGVWDDGASIRTPRVRLAKATYSDAYDAEGRPPRRYHTKGPLNRSYSAQRGHRSYAKHQARKRIVARHHGAARGVAPHKQSALQATARERRSGSVSTTDPAITGQHGVASYYWQPQRVAAGGWFDPDAMTAAHPTLPFGTRVRVTHLTSGRSVEVTINDRGPYIAGRIIDLSRAAAGVLGMMNQGIADVAVEVLEASCKELRFGQSRACGPPREDPELLRIRSLMVTRNRCSEQWLCCVARATYEQRGRGRVHSGAETHTPPKSRAALSVATRGF